MIDPTEAQDIVESVAEELQVSVDEVVDQVGHLVTVEERERQALDEKRISEEQKRVEFSELARKLGNIQLNLTSVIERLTELSEG